MLPTNARVKDLINTDTKTWKTTLIKEVFWEEEAESILNIPLSPLNAKDRRIWRGTKNGEYSVRSAYHMEMEWSMTASSSCSDPHKGINLWQNIWKRRIPNTVKMFLWKAFNNLLPTKANLYKRGVVKENSCPICGNEEETVSHALWECLAARDVWGGSLRKFQKASGRGNDFSRVFEDLHVRCDSQEMDLFAVLARKIWLRRNKVVHENSFTDPNRLCQEVVGAVEDFWKANSEDEDTTGQHLEVIRQPWHPPTANEIKINWDAAVSKQCGRIGLGIIARDSRGKVVAAQSISKPFLVDPTTAEMIAASYGVLLGKELGVSELTFEGDAKQVVQAVNAQEPCDSIYGHIVEGIQDALKELSRSNFKYIEREGNCAAHGLCKGSHFACYGHNVEEYNSTVYS